MIATILDCETYTTLKGSFTLKLKVEVDNEITYVFASLEAFETLIKPLLSWCYLPLIQKSKPGIIIIQDKKLIGKLVPVKEIVFRDKKLWTLDHHRLYDNYISMRKINDTTKMS